MAASTAEGRRVERRRLGAKDEAGGNRREELVRHDEEYGLRSGALERRGQIDAADHADGDGRGQGKDDPGHRDVRGLLDFFGGTDGHEAHEDVRLSEVAEAPGQQGDELDEADGRPVLLRQRIEHRGVDAFDAGNHMLQTAGSHCAADRYDEDGEEHHHALDEVRTGDGEEAADERVEDDGAGTDEDRILIRHAEHGLEETSGGHEARGRIDHEEDEDEDRRHDPEQAARIVIAVLQELRQREGVLGDLRVFPQSGGDEMPVGPGADGDADRDPACVQSGEIGEARHAHEHPAAHVRGLGGKRGDPGAELPVAEKIIAHVARTAVVIDANAHHEADIKYECRDDGDIMCQDISS